MSLAKLEYPIYNIFLPISNQKIEYRPYNNRERKNLMSALEFENKDDLNTAIKNIVRVCTFEKIKNIDDMNSTEVEYLFLMIKSKSTGDHVPINYECQNQIPTTNEETKEVEYHTCETEIKASIDLVKVSVANKDTNPLIKLSDTVAVKMKFPTFKIYTENLDKFEDNPEDIATKIIYDCVESIIDGDEIKKPELDFSFDDFSEFLDELTGDLTKKFTEFFSKLPQIEYTMELKCPSCGLVETFHLEGLESFLE
jgi:hypothetical protein